MGLHRVGDEYRYWNTVCDRYETPPMPRAVARCFHYRRTGRASYSGTIMNLHHADTHVQAAWDKERCADCEAFHHPYVPATATTEGCCDDPNPKAREHRIPCAERRAAAPDRKPPCPRCRVPHHRYRAAVPGQVGSGCCVGPPDAPYHRGKHACAPRT